MLLFPSTSRSTIPAFELNFEIPFEITMLRTAHYFELYFARLHRHRKVPYANLVYIYIYIRHRAPKATKWSAFSALSSLPVVSSLGPGHPIRRKHPRLLARPFFDLFFGAPIDHPKYPQVAPREVPKVPNDPPKDLKSELRASQNLYFRIYENH